MQGRASKNSAAQNRTAKSSAAKNRIANNRTARRRVLRRAIGAIVITCALSAVFATAMSFLMRPIQDSAEAAAVATCPPAAPVTVRTIVVPAGPVAGFCQDRLVNAAQVMAAARDLGIGNHTQTIGVMTAIGESSLRNLASGDDAGPDSRGLFQQRDNGAWGTLTERMDPYTAAHRFFSKLVKIPDWKLLEPTEAAHAVQRNADPEHYTRSWSDAQAVVAALSAGDRP